MQKHLPRWLGLIERLKERLSREEFCQRHRRQDKDFTRERLLTFPVVMLLLLQKTTRSIQRHVHSFLRQLWPEGEAVSVTPGGWTQARAKLRHTAFIELNEQILLPEFYAAEHSRRWRGFRLLGLDGSSLRLPAHPEVAQEFGVRRASNQRGETGRDYTVARFSVLYDLLNHLGLGAELAPQTTSELELVQRQLHQVHPGDVLIWDRGLTGFLLLAQTRARGAHFLGRCSRHSFFAAQEMFRRNRAGRSQTGRACRP